MNDEAGNPCSKRTTGAVVFTGNPIKHSDTIGFNPVDGCRRHAERGLGCTGPCLGWLRSPRALLSRFRQDCFTHQDSSSLYGCDLLLGDLSVVALPIAL